LYTLYSKLYAWGRDTFTNEHMYNSLAGVGSFSLEFYFLSQILGTDEYRNAADKIFQHLGRYEGNDGTVPSYWNVMTGEPTHTNGGLGSGSDSFIEYLLKVPLLACARSAHDTLACDDQHRFLKDMLRLYHKIVKLVRSEHFVLKKGDSSIAYPADNAQYYQLLCFVPGLIALGKVADMPDFALAVSLIQGCHDMYHQSPLGLGPEALVPNHNDNPPSGDKRYLLRPEYVESLFIMYRLSGNQEFQDLGWEVYQSLERYCKTDLGYTGINDVYNADDSERIDHMPSYFIAETLKYLLLLFAPDDYLSLDLFVFTTEAHPMRRELKKEKLKKFKYIQTELSSSKYEVQAPFPSLLAAILAVAGVFIGLIVVLLKKAVSSFVFVKKAAK